MRVCGPDNTTSDIRNATSNQDEILSGLYKNKKLVQNYYGQVHELAGNVYETTTMGVGGIVCEGLNIKGTGNLVKKVVLNPYGGYYQQFKTYGSGNHHYRDTTLSVIGLIPYSSSPGGGSIGINRISFGDDYKVKMIIKDGDRTYELNKTLNTGINTNEQTFTLFSTSPDSTDLTFNFMSEIKDLGLSKNAYTYEIFFFMPYGGIDYTGALIHGVRIYS